MSAARVPARRGPARLVAVAIVAAAAGGSLTAGAVALGTAAQAAFVDVPATGAPGRLILSADPYPADFLDLSPGDPSFWQISARVQDAARATVALEFRKSGTVVAHPRGLVLTIEECTERWRSVETYPVCDSGPRPIAVATPAEDDTVSSPTFDLTPLSPGREDHLLVTLAVADSAAARADTTLMGLRGDIGVGITAVSLDDAPAGPGGHLPATGVDTQPLLAVVLLAAGLLGFGVAARLARGRATP